MDIFCQINEKLKNQIIHETHNFYLLHDGYPLLESHLLIIPKKHYLSFLELDETKKKEFTQLRTKVEKFMIQNYRKPVCFEHGRILQTIPHAHFHILPTDKSIIKKLLKVTKIIKRPVKQYLYYNEKGKEYYLYPKKTLKPGFLHLSFATELNRPTSGPARAKELSKWLLKVKKNWKLWRRKMGK
ncbi:hypothetical protein COY89_02020 [Candidatus Roizmanbacteria bacterium CG_4_10_14_0_8_um_filter_36_36]|uniref:HIT domain-containing protein n=1 Tax=Candidatus Roizmanbacteria bacterium CG_4_8_14_3_um_filter_36_10 TaxID=1974834 RepID=A0A2M8GLD4_9BACT|nr:MAG: hypothetical protein COY89_02020 [Candidatus Roizmanbacteria bacterium CG_4_10_14_0_8_um_filter_36_36]PJA53367.1 MAG: hypothetical protein CO166_02120 [Candidatus Roizmanbacteria bacterium CG_4_9_14_3_um_filter_36_11]PJC81370.1 MAG: hypothetical protein CO007_05225 [Candidatus Roizmanbacteria bacterium CG_4_8_14_3_um_filter_36_10]